MVFSRSLSVCCLIALASLSLGACSSEGDGEDEKPDMAAAGQGGAPSATAGDLGLGGSTAGSAGIVATPSAGAGVSGSSVSSAGTGGSAGSAGADTAGSGGSMASAGSSAADAGGQPDAGVPAEEDPFAGLLGPAEVSCEGLLCLDAADCATLYPEENTTCKFTSCVDFVCM